MNKEEKQWKKIFANKYLLLIVEIFLLAATICVVNFVLSFFLNVQTFIQAIKEYALNGTNSMTSLIHWEWFLDFHVSLFWIYLFVLIFVLIVSLIRLHEIYESFKDINKHTKGSSRFTTIPEIKEQYTSVKDDSKGYEGKAGIPILHIDDRVYIDTNSTNAMVIASTQSGKTEMFSYPTHDLVIRSGEKPSIIVTDPKGDMLKNTRHEYEKNGYDVYVLNLINPDWGISYNPLELIKQAYINKEFAKAQMLCNTLSYSLFHNPNAKDPMWEESSIALVNALILAVCDICISSGKPENITMYTLTVMLNELGSDPDENGYTKLDHFFGSLPASNPAKLQYGTVQFSQGVTRSGIYTGTMAKLKNYTYDTIGRMTSQNTFNIEDLAFGEKPVALFIVYPDWDDSNYTIISTFLSQSNAVLSERATLTQKGSLPRRVFHLFEEFANIPAIEGINRSLAVGLSRGLIYFLVLQNKAQLAEKYGDKMAESIAGNCGNQIYIMSDEVADSEEFSKKLGPKTVVTGDRSGESLSTKKSFGEKEEERPLLMPDELRRLKKGEWIVIRSKKREDLKGKRIINYPIFANIKDGTQMLHRYEYLMDRFHHPIAFKDMGLDGTHKNLDLNDILIKFELFNETENEQEVTAPVTTEESDIASTRNEKEMDIPVENMDITVEMDITEDITEPVDQDISYDFSYMEESAIEDIPVEWDENLSHKGGIGDFMDQIEPVYEESTPILDAITLDKYNYIKLMAKKYLSEDEYSMVERFSYIEELRTYFESPEKEIILDKIKNQLK